MVEKKEKREEILLSSLGLMFPASILVGVGLGYLLDNFLKTFPYLTVIFTVLGIFAGFYNVLKVYWKMKDE
ncbi:MAG: AtpZ/AtpI family protein [Candidatus Aminicenantia bacterium]